MIKLIPMPNNLTVKQGDCFIYRNRVLLHIDEELAPIGKFAEKCLCVKTEKAENESHIEFIFDDTLGEETYTLKAEGYGVKVFAGTYSGAFYGLMTLSQLLLTDKSDSETLTCPQLIIEKDSPKYSWRGLQLDESRHFFGKDTVKKYLDKDIETVKVKLHQVYGAALLAAEMCSLDTEKIYNSFINNQAEG